MLQGLPLNHTDEIPTWALFMSSSLRPTAYNIAWEAPWDLGCVMWRETLLRALSFWKRGMVVERVRLKSNVQVSNRLKQLTDGLTQSRWTGTSSGERRACAPESEAAF